MAKNHAADMAAIPNAMEALSLFSQIAIGTGDDSAAKLLAWPLRDLPSSQVELEPAN